MICLFLQIVEDTVCLVLALLVDVNYILLCCFMVDLTGVILVELAGVVKSLI